MDRNFDKALTLVLKHEGGWADNPNDRGGPTMKGVTLGTFRSLVKADATKEDLRKISTAQLGVIYRRHYWDKVLGSKLPGGVDYAVFDFAVNSGWSRAAKFLQKVVGAKVDGRVGPATLAAVEAMGRKEIITALCDRRLAWLKTLKGKKGWPTFGKGWGRRVADVRVAALAMPFTEKTVTVEIPVPIEVEKEVVPPKIDSEVKQKTNWLQTVISGLGLSGGGIAAFFGSGWQTVAVIAGAAVVVMLLVLLLRTWLVKAIREIREGLAA